MKHIRYVAKMSAKLVMHIMLKNKLVLFAHLIIVKNVNKILERNFLYVLNVSRIIDFGDPEKSNYKMRDSYKFASLVKLVAQHANQKENNVLSARLDIIFGLIHAIKEKKIVLCILMMRKM